MIELHSPDRAEEKLIQLTFDPYDPLYVVQQFILGKCHIYHRNWNSARKKFEYVLNQLNRHFEFDKSNLAAVCHLYLAKIAFFKDKNLIKALDHIRLGKEVYQQDGDRVGII